MATPPTFVAGQVLTAAQMNKIGMWRTYSTTTAGTATTVQVDNCFSADYRHYRLYISGYSATLGNLVIQMSVGGVAATGSNYYWNMATRNYNAADASTNSAGATTSFLLGLLNNGTATAYSNIVCDILDPFASSHTGFSAMNNYNTTSFRTCVGTHYLRTSYDGFKLTGAGNLNLNIEVFGMN